MASKGFTLIELMITIAIMAIILAIAAPSFSQMLEKERLKTAASSVAEDLVFARNEAIRLNASSYFTLETTGGWKYSICTANGASSCNCTATTSTTASNGTCKRLFTKAGSSWNNVSSDASNFDSAFLFDPVNGMPRDTDGSKWADSGKKALTLSSANGYEAHIAIGSSSRVKICTSSDDSKKLGSYPAVTDVEDCL
ncbi:Tfp pilus assembly protein FimT/FimU [Chitinibacter sp. S2-10]|uniref:pilus assembly FimT family protein n=1 Tax=Chitinibacter sp. S2-10 TaxID=3373597 RepID=UPI003977ADB2